MRLFVQKNIDRKVLSFLQERFECIEVLQNERLEEPIKAHIDLQIFAFADKTAVCAPFCETFYKKHLPDYKILCGETPKSPYPSDILYNCFVCAGYLFCNEKQTDKTLLKLAAERGLQTVNIKQGYAKCSTVVLHASKIITADRGIAAEAKKRGIEALITTNSGVFLQGYNNGFLGGSSFVCGDKLYFTGDVSRHTDFEKIKTFAEKEIIYMPGALLYDFGNINPF